MLALEYRLGTITGQVLYLIGKFLAAVVASARIALGIFVREDTAECCEHLRKSVILGRNQLDPASLALFLAL